jgi:hypothetical protein
MKLILSGWIICCWTNTKCFISGNTLNCYQARYYFWTDDNSPFTFPVLEGDVFGKGDTVVCSSGRVYNVLSPRGRQKHRQRDQRNLLERNYTANAPGMSVIVFVCGSVFQFGAADQTSLCYINTPSSTSLTSNCKGNHCWHTLYVLNKTKIISLCYHFQCKLLTCEV